MEELKHNRRQFIKNSLMASGGILFASNFISCSSDDNPTLQTSINTSSFGSSNFTHGVASFDPTSSKVIIWTRYDLPDKELLWEIATDNEFNNVLRSGTITTEASRDNTIAIELTELSENLSLYYRFINQNDQQVSPIGETITLPTHAASIKLAVCSCSNYQAGYFNVYHAMAQSEADIIVHLGDYIYETGAGGYEHTETLERTHQPANELVSLDDYRTRYKQYRADADLQLAHQKKPFICVWDDHEIADNAYKNGANGHSETTQGSFATRKEQAVKAYSEYVPFTQTVLGNEELIYRSFNLGNLVNLMMIDTRVIGRDKQLNIQNYFTPTSIDFATYNTEVFDANRTILGDTQRDWLTDQLQSNSLKWQVLGQQVLMGKMNFPAEMLTAFGTPNFDVLVRELVLIKSRLLAGDPTLTDQEKTRVTTALPYNLDAWDGYPIERENIYNALANKKIITLAGDTHNGWSHTLRSATGTAVGIEIATAGISSPGFENIIDTSDPTTIPDFELALTTLIDDLNYVNASKRGFVLTTFTNTEVKADWMYVNTVLDKNYTTSLEYSTSFS